MSKKFVEDKAIGLIKNLGRTTAHYLFPNDIEYYFVAFELVDSQDRTIQYFGFPVNPQSIIFQDAEITKIQRTLGGITTIKTTTFDPKTYTLQGEFGRTFKTMVNGNLFNFSGISFGSLQEFFDVKNFRIGVPELSIEIKNGYGCIKVLESMIKSAKKLDDEGNPYRLYFYNTSLNHQYLVEPQDFTFSQNLQKNMLWQYNLRLNVVARLEDMGNARKSIANSLSISSINRALSGISRKLDVTLNRLL